MMFLIQLFRTLIMVQVLECLLAVLYVCIPVANVNHNQEYQTYLTARDGDYFSHRVTRLLSFPGHVMVDFFVMIWYTHFSQKTC